jgi:hypothetical protein
MLQIFSVVFITILTIQTVSASIPAGGTLVTGSSSTNATPVSSGTSPAAGGYVTEINISTTHQQTTNWQGFWGNVTGGTIYLNDSSGNYMYRWAMNEANGGFVYATTKTTAPTWSSVTAISAATLDSASYWNMAGKSDSIANTYNKTRDLVIAGYPVTGASNTTVNTYFNDSVISDASSANRAGVIWVGEINNDKTNFKTTTSSDYELLVPVIAGDVYYFYMEIS